MKKPLRILAVAEISADDVECLTGWLEPLAESVWLSRTCECRRYALRGVPSRLCDIAIDRRLTEPGVLPLRPWESIACEASRREGRYDGRERDRLTIRAIPRQTLAIWCAPSACLSVALRDDATYEASLVLDGGATSWHREYRQLRVSLDERPPRDVVLWHWSRYYQHLDAATAEQVADLWSLGEYARERDGWSLAEANRSASRALYVASRQEGWRKLTLRERRKLGLPDSSGQWHRSDACAALSGTASGCGRYTLDSASGVVPTPGQWYLSRFAGEVS